MVSHRSEGLAKLLVFTQVLLTIGVFSLCAELTFGLFAPVTQSQLWEHYPYYCTMVLAGLIAEAVSRKEVDMRVKLVGRNLLLFHAVALRQTFFAVGALLAYLAVAKDLSISRTFLGVLAVALYATYVGSSYVIPRLMARHIFRGIREERTILIGSLPQLHRIVPWLKEKEAMGFQTLGILSDSDASPGQHSGFPFLGSVHDIRKVVEAHRPTQLLLLELPRDAEVHRRFVRTGEEYGLRLLILNNLSDVLKHPVIHFEDEGCQFIGIRREPLENPFNRTLKRALDVAVALPFVVCVLPPLCLIVWLLQRSQSAGPLFFLQTRAGLQNHRFQLVKFRTMYCENDDPARQTASEDSRVFPVGRWLRKLSLDEIPQFYNVLIGDMSVVGPRPHMVEHNAQFAGQLSGYNIRTFVKPGITGLAQVRGFRGEIRSTDDLVNRLGSDLAYLENWTLAMDLVVIVRTAWQMLFPPKGAY
jgi:exopolysaccharide biosynthesis polyprenyl glycosylphosphotransferase